MLPPRAGRIDLSASAPRASTQWTDHGTSRQARGLKHRASNETRSIPIPPVLVQMLRAHIARHVTGPGGLLHDTGYGEFWQRARRQDLTPPSRHPR